MVIKGVGDAVTGGVTAAVSVLFVLLLLLLMVMMVDCCFCGG